MDILGYYTLGRKAQKGRFREPLFLGFLNLKNEVEIMKKIYQGKTKDIYELDDHLIQFLFKDDVTGKDGVFDPGENQVGLSIDGVGKKNLKMSKYFFDILKERGISTHYVDCDVENNTMTVKKAKTFRQGVEVITRYKAVGSFIRRYGLYAKEGQDLDCYVEFTLKDDERKDPLITKEALAMLDIIDEDSYEIIRKLNIEIAEIIREELAKKDLVLYDLKLEFGVLEETGEICLIDEVSGGNMRVYKDDKYITPMDLDQYFN